MTPEDLRELILALAALLAAATPIVLAFLHVNGKVDNLSEKVDNHITNGENHTADTPQ